MRTEFNGGLVAETFYMAEIEYLYVSEAYEGKDSPDILQRAEE